MLSIYKVYSYFICKKEFGLLSEDLERKQLYLKNYNYKAYILFMIGYDK